jgi:hypothetical protein
MMRAPPQEIFPGFNQDNAHLAELPILRHVQRISWHGSEFH